jgi:hypothetical protein
MDEYIRMEGDVGMADSDDIPSVYLSCSYHFTGTCRKSNSRSESGECYAQHIRAVGWCDDSVVRISDNKR